jgi:hypothetical protein
VLGEPREDTAFAGDLPARLYDLLGDILDTLPADELAVLPEPIWALLD